MNPEDIALVQQTFDDTDHTALAQHFYEHLFGDHPEVQSMFSTEPTVQQQKFIDELTAIVWSIQNLGDFLDRTMALGARHVDYGTESGHYKWVREALLGALHDELGDAFTDEVRAAWVAAYDLVAEAMMMGAANGVRH